MTADRLSDDELDELGGNCKPYVQLGKCFRDRADELGLRTRDRHALFELVMASDFQTGIIASTTWDEVATIIGCSRPTAQDRLDALASAGAVRYRFPRGHPGFVVVRCYLDVVRVKPASRAEDIAKAQAKAVEKANQADKRAANRLAATQEYNGASPVAVGTHNATSLRSDAEILRSDEPTPLPNEPSEPPAVIPVSGLPESPSPLSSSTAGVGDRNRQTTSALQREATRSDRVRAYDAILFGERT